jgi:hypothetical protein
MGASDLVINRCQNTVRHTSCLVLCWLLSAKPQSYHDRPFSLVAEEASERKYRILEQRLVAFVLRTYRMSTAVREREIKIRLSSSLHARLESVWDHQVWDYFDWSEGIWPLSGELIHTAYVPNHHTEDMDTSEPVLEMLRTAHNKVSIGEEQDEEQDEDTEECDDESDGEDKEDSDVDYDEVHQDDAHGDDQDKSDCMNRHNGSDRKRQCPSIDRRNDRPDGYVAAAFSDFLELLFHVCLGLCTETFIDGQPDSALLIFFSRILGFSGQQSMFAKQYSPQLSGLIYIQRILLLEYALPQQPYTTVAIARCPREQRFEQLYNICQNYMTLGSQSPLAELLSLRNFGLAVARTEPPSVFFHWSDDGEILSCSNLTLSMTDFRKLPAYFITQAENLCDSLMFGFKPRIDLTTVKDGLTSSQSGNSFVEH